MLNLLNEVSELENIILTINFRCINLLVEQYKIFREDNRRIKMTKKIYFNDANNSALDKTYPKEAINKT